MLGINARVEDLRSQLIQLLNGAKMPACILDYILTEILNDVRMQRMNEVQKERKLHREEIQKADAGVLQAQEVDVLGDSTAGA